MALIARNYENLVGVAKDIETSGGRALPIKCGVTESRKYCGLLKALWMSLEQLIFVLTMPRVVLACINGRVDR